MLRPTLSASFFLFAALLFTSVASAQPDEHAHVSPGKAREVLDTLQNEDRREEVVRVLEVIASETPAGEEGESGAVDESPLATIVPLEEDGLIARTLDVVQDWADRIQLQLLRITEAAAELPDWFEESFLTAEGRMLLWQTALDLAIVFGVGLCLEWLLRRGLSRSMRNLLRSAREAELRPAAVASAPVLEQAEAEVLAARRPLDDNTALVQTLRDGVESVEAVTVPSYESAADTAAAAALPAAGPAPVKSAVKTLHRLPFALTGFVLDLLPLGLFFGIAALVLQLLPGLDIRTHLVTREIIYAYVATRVVMAVVRLLVSPEDASLRIMHLSDEAAKQVHRWTRRLVVLATFGVALGNALAILGSGAQAQLLTIKTTSLLVHLNLIVLVFLFRQPVARWLAGPAEAEGVVAALRRWLAGAWPLLAAGLILGGWIVWALSIEDGFTRLLKFLGLSAAIIVLGRLVGVLALGALGRLAGIDEGGTPGEHGAAGSGLRGQFVARYYTLLRWLFTLLISAATLVALLEAWGVEALHWFAAGTIGRGLASAFGTIAVAVIVALMIWQASNTAIERRIVRWRAQGDLMRAARLNTLLPMLRAALFLLVALIIGLTTLNQLGINTTPLIAGASIIGVAIGFGSQKLVQDFITGIFLLMENTMQVGDSVTVAGVSGTVENLSIRTVRLRAGDGSLHIIPFSSVTTVNNSHRGIGNAAVRISVAYDTDIALAIAELEAIGAELRRDPAFAPRILADIEIWGVDAVDGAMVTIAGQMRCVDKGRWGVQREINRRILERFRALGITIADPRERPFIPAGDQRRGEAL